MWSYLLTLTKSQEMVIIKPPVSGEDCGKTQTTASFSGNGSERVRNKEDEYCFCLAGDDSGRERCRGVLPVMVVLSVLVVLLC